MDILFVSLLIILAYLVACLVKSMSPGSTVNHDAAAAVDPDQEEEPENQPVIADDQEQQQQQPDSWKNKKHGDYIFINGKMYWLHGWRIPPKKKKPDWLLPWWQRSDYQHQVAWRKKLDEEWRQECEWHHIGLMLYIAYTELEGWCTYRTMIDWFNGSLIQFLPPEGFYESGLLSPSKPYTYSNGFIQASLAYIDKKTFELCEYRRAEFARQHSNYWIIGEEIGKFTVEKSLGRGNWGRKVINITTHCIERI